MTTQMTILIVLFFGVGIGAGYLIRELVQLGRDTAARRRQIENAPLYSSDLLDEVDQEGARVQKLMAANDPFNVSDWNHPDDIERQRARFATPGLAQSSFRR